MNKTKTQERVLKVLGRIHGQVSGDADYATWYSEALEDMLDVMAQDDGFGTEGQCDPRGDGREGRFTMLHVEGVDA